MPPEMMQGPAPMPPEMMQQMPPEMAMQGAPMPPEGMPMNLTAPQQPDMLLEDIDPALLMQMMGSAPPL